METEMPYPNPSEKHICLVTLKRDGTAVETAVWFAEADGKLYLRTIANSGKVKRIRNHPRVRLAPCTITGKVTGPWIDAHARLLNPSDPLIQVANLALDTKYGDERRDMTRLMEEQGKELVYIEVDVVQQAG
jgi:hypothetical protein